MAERQITIDGVTMKLEEPFMVMATQNPIESHGTFPLPEAQLDRFFMRLSLGYMERPDEKQVLARRSTLDIIENLECILTDADIQFMKDTFPSVEVSGEVSDYLMDIVEGTRRESRFITGVSTRGAIALYQAAQVTAAFEGRDYVIPEDIRHVAHPVLGHRIATGSGMDAVTARAFLDEIIEKIPVPLENMGQTHPHD
jgi:MoxR-like ATPase